MKFDKKDLKIKIKGEWYHLCACDNCGEVHASYNGDLFDVDKKIECCENQNNLFISSLRGEAVALTIHRFIEKWEDKNER